MTTLSDKINDIICKYTEGASIIENKGKEDEIVDDIDTQGLLDEIMETVKDEVYSALGHVII